MARFGCPNKIITDNTTSFKDEPLTKFCEQFRNCIDSLNSLLPQGNGLAESSNKILINIIKTLLEDNKKAWDSKLKYDLWADIVTTKRSLGVSPFHLVYGVEAIFPSQLALPVEKFFQDYQGDPDGMIRRIHQLVEVQQTREKALDKAHDHQQKIKQAFDRKSSKEDFHLGDLVLKLDAPKQDKGKHGKFEALQIGPFKVFEVFPNNTYRLQILEGAGVFGGPVNGNFLKKFLFEP
jgi:hypothetical protein